MAIRVRADGTTTSVENVSTKGITIVKRVTVGKPVRKINPAVLSIDNISGVDTSTKDDGYILVYNTTSGNWEAVENTAVGLLSGLNDVNATTRVDGSVLVYDDASEKWVAKTTLDEQTINGGQY